MRGLTLLLAGSITFSLSALTLADVPFYDHYQLQCRANFGAAFNLPAGSFFTSSTPAINDKRQVAVNLVNVNLPGDTDPPGIWFGQNGVGQVEWTSADVEASIGSISLNNGGFVIFPINFSSPNGIYFYNSVADAGGVLTTQPIGSSSYAAPIVNDANQVGYRVSFNGPQAWVSYAGGAQVAFHALEVGLDPNSRYSFLFTPSFNNARQIAGKVRLGGPGQTGNERPDQIRIFNADGTSTLIAQDRDGDPNSPFRSFDNSVSLTHNGWVAFIADLQPSGRGVFLSNGVLTQTIATTVNGDVASIDFFPPVANERGSVAFRAVKNGLRGIYVGDSVVLRLAVQEHGIVPTDLGNARIDQHDSSVVFGGAPAINKYGDVAFNAALTPPDNNQIEWGSGIFVALARSPGDLDCDGDVDFFDIDPLVLAFSGPDAYHAQYPDCRWFNGDCDNDGDVDFFDIDPFVALLGS